MTPGLFATGKAVVCCVHDRQKRVVVDPDQILYLGNILGVVYNPKHHKLVVCGCCQNLYVSPTDVPGLCPICVKEV